MARSRSAFGRGRPVSELLLSPRVARGTVERTRGRPPIGCPPRNRPRQRARPEVARPRSAFSMQRWNVRQGLPRVES
eukprot:5839365-Pyramimonas_sp.AAC.1